MNIHTSLAATLLGLLALSLPAAAQVTYIKAVPTVEELKAALARQRPAGDAGPVAPAAAARSRGIEFGSSPTPSATALAAKEPPGASERPSPSLASGLGPAVALPINFEVNSSRVAGPSAAYVEAVASLLAQDPSLRLAIEGHTDAAGSPMRNIMLSWDRAMSVFKVLVEKHGVDPQRLQPLGRGALEPLEGMLPTAPTNRRVQFRVVG